MITTTTAPALLHGDFITKNLVRDEAAPVGWLSLDPLPMIGDRAREVGAFAAYQPAELIMSVAEALAVETGVHPRRARVWAAIWAVHQSGQGWRDDQEALDRLVASRMINRLLRSV
jgi:streptomycin 6-kinase